MLGSNSRNFIDLVSLETNGLLTFKERNIIMGKSCGEYGSMHFNRVIKKPCLRAAAAA